MYTMNIKKKQEDLERELAIFLPRCTKRHLRNECPLNVIELYFICEENHANKIFPSLLDLNVIYQGEEGRLE